MPLKPLDGFQSLKTQHCVTGSMRHVYVYNNHDISEDMLLGLGAGVSFSYWHFKGTMPFMGGRGGFKPPMEQVAGQRSGVKVEMHSTSSARRARQALLEMLDGGQPVMVQCDMGFLPYFDFGGQEYHFGGHVVVVCGYEPETEQVLIADRDGLHPVPVPDLEKARGSTFKPFPPKNTWYTFDFRHKRQPTPAEVRQAIAEQARPMLEPPIRNIGVEGIRKASEAVPRWAELLPGEELRWTLFNAYIFISPVGGSGGGNFRYMFSRFLHEASEITADPSLSASADEFWDIADRWEVLGEWFRRTSEAPDRASRLSEAAALLKALADLEQRAWTRLQDVVQG